MRGRVLIDMQGEGMVNTGHQSFFTYRTREFVAPYLESIMARGAGGTVLDVGCGGSAMGFEVLQEGFFDLVLTDVSTEIIDIMRERFAGDARVRVEVADCRQMTFLPDGAADVVVDKGTLDALSGDDHKRDMLRECAR
jgi:ubiquinone/menaquinone biosynthesis C-methylase UbiE